MGHRRRHRFETECLGQATVRASQSNRWTAHGSVKPVDNSQLAPDAPNAGQHRAMPRAMPPRPRTDANGGGRSTDDRHHPHPAHGRHHWRVGMTRRRVAELWARAGLRLTRRRSYMSMSPLSNMCTHWLSTTCAYQCAPVGSPRRRSRSHDLMRVLAPAASGLPGAGVARSGSFSSATASTPSSSPAHPAVLPSVVSQAARPPGPSGDTPWVLAVECCFPPPVDVALQL
jgi:hypothetical protein